MAEEALPNEFDVIVIGTGLSESIVSGALSRIGKKVLHLDHSKHYGSSWSSFNLRAFESWIVGNEEEHINKIMHEEANHKINSDSEFFIPINTIRRTTEQGESICFIPPTVKNEESTKKDKPEDGEKLIDTATALECMSIETTNKLVETNTEVPESTSPSCVAEKTTAELPGVEHNSNESKLECSDDTEQVSVEKVGEMSGILMDSFSQQKSKQENDALTFDSFYSAWRHYNLDLAPKLMFSRGKLVELLITSNVCRYLEFRNVTRTLTLLDDGTDTHRRLAPVPCSRTDVFTSKFVTMIEKRMLMRLLTMCASYENHPEEYQDFVDGKFVDFLAAKKLSKKLQHFILHSISMVDHDTGTLDGLKATQKFLKSLGRYGNSAFLWPLYGVGELPQAFCRLSAVFGGTFCLKRSLSGLVINKESGNCIGIIDTTGQRLDCEHLILDECYVPESHRVPFKNMVSRAIYVTDGSLLPADSENVSLVTIPPAQDLPSSRLIEVGSACCVSPKKYYLVHAMTSIQPTESDVLPSPRSQFTTVEKILFEDIKIIEDKMENEKSTQSDTQFASQSSDPPADEKEVLPESRKPQVLWASYFNMMSGGVNTDSIPSNVHITRGPSMDLGFDETVLEAKNLFETICPDEEFLPRAPNPDEILYFDQDDEGYNTEGNGGAGNAAQQDEGGDYQEDESEVEAGSGEPADQEELTEDKSTNDRPVTDATEDKETT